MSYFRRISVYEADALLAQNPEAILLDIRDQQSFKDSHHPRAVLLDDTKLRQLVKNGDKNQPVIIYCYHGNSSKDIARMFADFGFKECYSVDGGYTAWQHQIGNTFPVTPRLKTWLEKKDVSEQDINTRVDEQARTPLMLAAREGDALLVRDLVEAGAEPNYTDTKGNNALWYACLSQSIDCVRILINADIEADNQNDAGFSALNYAVGMDEIFNLLASTIGDNSLVRLGNVFNSQPDTLFPPKTEAMGA